MTSLLWSVATPLLLLGVLVILSFVGRLDQRRRHRMELACDRFSTTLTGDPLAMAVLLHTITVLAGIPLRQRSQTHPTFNQRVAALLQVLYEAGPRAPWAFRPVPADIPFGTPQTSYTVPMDQAPAPAPVRRAPVQAAILPVPMPQVAPYMAAPMYAPVYAPAPVATMPPYAPPGYPYVPPYPYPAQAPMPMLLPAPAALPVAHPPSVAQAPLAGAEPTALAGSPRPQEGSGAPAPDASAGDLTSDQV